MTPQEHDALTIFIESVQKPDNRLRGCAYNQGCYDELMKIRAEVLDYLYKLKRND